MGKSYVSSLIFSGEYLVLPSPANPSSLKKVILSFQIEVFFFLVCYFLVSMLLNVKWLEMFLMISDYMQEFHLFSLCKEKFCLL